MGFMGFGMQKWVYTMRPRKPFSMERKKSFTSIPSDYRKFKLQHSNNKGRFNIPVLLIIIFTVLVGLMIPKWSAYERERINNNIAMKVERDNSAFQFLLKSGKNRLCAGNIYGAYSEFCLALKLKPKNTELKNLLSETLEILCFEHNDYCQELDNIKL